MEYRILEATSAEALQNEVTTCINRGWRPLGGLCVVNSQANSGNWYFYQAMIREGSSRRRNDPEDTDFSTDG
jgi:hypothetical protein